ncbi:hypothetical protein ACFX1X_038647 [Malus domestica]
MAKFVWSVTNNTAIVEWYNACQEALLETLHLTTHATSELHIATSWQTLKSFWNALTITDYIMEIEFLWENDIKRGFEQQWLSSTFSWATSEVVMAKARSQWYFSYQKTQVSILKAQVKSSSVSPSYMAHQPDINKKMRVILIDWLIKVHYKFELMDEAQFFTVT